MTGEQIRLGGTTWLDSFARPGGLKYSFAANGGCEQASWTMTLPAGFNHPALAPGQLVEIRTGPTNVWSGTLAEPDRGDGEWSFSAAGVAADLRDSLALTVGGDTTSTPDVAIDRAISVGVRCTRPASLSNAPYASSDETVSVNRTGDLLDAWSDSVSKRWGVNADRQVYAAVDPTAPALYLSAGSVMLGLADDDYASNLYGRYQSGPNAYVTATVSDPVAAAAYRREVDVDLTSLGIIDSTKATAVLNGMLAKGKARYALTKAFTVSNNQLTNPGGQPACLSFVTAQLMVRAFGVLDPQGQPLPYYDFVIGRTEYDVESELITLAPVALAARTLGDVLALAVGS